MRELDSNKWVSKYTTYLYLYWLPISTLQTSYNTLQLGMLTETIVKKDPYQLRSS